MRGGGCDDHILSDGRLHLSPFPPAPKEQVRSIPAGFKSESVAGFLLECVAGFVGIRTHP